MTKNMQLLFTNIAVYVIWVNIVLIRRFIICLIVKDFFCATMQLQERIDGFIKDLRQWYDCSRCRYWRWNSSSSGKYSVDHHSWNAS